MEAWNDAANSRDSYNTPSIPLFFLSFSFSLSFALLLLVTGILPLNALRGPDRRD